VGDSIRAAGAWWRHRVVLAADHPPATSEYEVDLTTFSGLMIPTEVVNHVGVPDPSLFMMWEEYEYCLRVRGAGYRIVILNQPLTRFQAMREAERYGPWRAYYQARNSLAVLLRRRHPAELAWWAIRQGKFLVAAIGHDDREQQIALRLKGMIDALRRRSGLTVEPH